MKKRPPWLNRWVRIGSCTRPMTCSMKRETWRESLRERVTSSSSSQSIRVSAFARVISGHREMKGLFIFTTFGFKNESLSWPLPRRFFRLTAHSKAVRSAGAQCVAKPPDIALRTSACSGQEPPALKRRNSERVYDLCAPAVPGCEHGGLRGGHHAHRLQGDVNGFNAAREARSPHARARTPGLRSAPPQWPGRAARHGWQGPGTDSAPSRGPAPPRVHRTA